VLGDTERVEILQHQDLSGVDWVQGGCGHVVSSQW
jgi:hypothetical protein